MYYDYLLVSPYLVKEKPKILILGNGTGTYATLLKNYMNLDCDITAVEIDQKIIDLSYEYFHMSEDINIICDDGRNYLSRTKEMYDIILVDAYSSISAPFQMTTTEFFTMCKNHLVEDGLMMMNINMVASSEDSINQALCDTVTSVFGTTYTLRVPNGSGIETYSFNGDVDMRAELETITSEDYRFTAMVERLKDGLKIHEDTGIRLYDDTADVEIRSIRALDELINEELEYYRETFREYGLRGLMEELFDN